MDFYGPRKSKRGGEQPKGKHFSLFFLFGKFSPRCEQIFLFFSMFRQKNWIKINIKIKTVHIYYCKKTFSYLYRCFNYIKCVCFYKSFFSRSSYKKEELSDDNLWIIRYLSEKKKKLMWLVRFWKSLISFQRKFEISFYRTVERDRCWRVNSRIELVDTNNRFLNYSMLPPPPVHFSMEETGLEGQL